MSVPEDVLEVLDSVLNLKGRSKKFASDTPLLGHIPELDSMAVVSLLTAIEERFGLTIEDDEIDGSTFATVGSLTRFVDSKLGG